MNDPVTVHGRYGKVIGYNGAANVYQVMIDGSADYYKSTLLKKADSVRHKTDKSKLKRKKEIKAKKVIQINNQK